MKKTKFLAIIIAVILSLAGIFSACKSSSGPAYTITLNTSKSYILEVGDEVDYTQYFVIKDRGGKQVEVTESMLDLSKADTSKPGFFTITVTIGGISKTATFTVKQPTSSSNYVITLNTSKSFVLQVGDVVDYTQYFIIKDKKGNQILVTEDMLDLSKVDTSKPGTFTVTASLDGASKSATFTVQAKGSAPDSPDLPSGFDRENLQDKMLKVDGAIGLPSTGDIHALVIPVQFKGDTITQSQLTKLNTAFNGDEASTGWESVKTYYQKASYGKLNLTFDIQAVYQAKYNASYYEGFQENYQEGGYTYTRTGEEIVLMEALSYYESRLDLTQYDTNDDGTIDAVYLIYSADVDYDEGDFYWAYTTWYYGENQYDGLDAYYYFFAGFDFMDESTANDSSGYGTIPGLKVNAATYIHETGHILGLDDYYDYETNKGCNEGLGGADMMDYTVGDHNVYSKIMLGWLTPTIVNETKTVTIQSSCANASAILIPLNFNNSYFCEYLLIDLYSAQGLNALHSSVNNSYLYDGASYGVRIYHVSSSIENPYSDEYYGSFTDYNNTSTKYALIKLVEADGEKKFSSSGGFAAASDLWKAGDRLSDKFPAYTRNDGTKVNFDIVISSVSAASASITITFH